jgi:A/G-specific adenine glycosylase
MRDFCKQLTAFRSLIWRHYRDNGRSLPWRETKDPYWIVVSEIMLQQTQVARVTPYYQRFLQRFPTWHALAQASLHDVLREWQGLGYNRRAKALREMAQIVTKDYQGILPSSEQQLLALPGIGRYTAAAILVFAFDRPALLIETNIRSALISHFFANNISVSDLELQQILERLQPRARSKLRPWYYALMDYGAALKAKGLRLNQRSAHYRPSTAFKGSARQIRGGILRLLSSKGSITSSCLLRELAEFDKQRVQCELQRLVQEGMLVKDRRQIRIAD